MISNHKNKKQLTLFLLGIAMLISANAVSNDENASQKVYHLNPTNTCKIEYSYDKRGYIINGNKNEVFNSINNKYFVSKEKCLFTEFKNDSTVFKLSNYQFKDYRGQLFIDNKKVGTVQKSDIIILHHNKQIDVYNKSKVKVVEKTKTKK